MRRFAMTPFGRIAYVERGTGPAAVFLHGWPLNGFQWRGAIERLAGHRRCIAPDFVGLGYSEGPAGADVTPRAQARMIAALLDRLGIDAIDVVCNDSGGVIAQLFATLYPQRVRTLLITTTEVGQNNPPPSFRPVVQLARQGVLAQLFPVAALASYDQGRAGGLGQAYTDPANLTDECIETYLRPLVSSPERIAQFHAYTVALDENVLVPIEPQLRRFRAPARLVWSEQAAGFPVETAQWLDQALPGSRGLRIVPGAKLFFPEEMPDIIAEEAVRLWSG
jgi:pimeloyl-ACP methyl ester carboxylesterase